MVRKKFARVVTAAVLIALAGIVISAGQNRTRGPETAPQAAARFSQDLLITTYPELVTSRLSFVLDDQVPDVQLTVRKCLIHFSWIRVSRRARWSRPGWHSTPTDSGGHSKQKDRGCGLKTTPSFGSE